MVDTQLLLEKDSEFQEKVLHQNLILLFRDYPHELTPEQKKIFDEENPYWKEFFSDRK